MSGKPKIDWGAFKAALILDPVSDEVINYVDLAEEYHVGVAAIRARVAKLRKLGELPMAQPTKRLDIYRRWYSEAEVKRLKYMVEHRMRLVDIADELGRSVSSVTSKVTREAEKGRIKRPSRKFEPSELVGILVAVKLDASNNVVNYPSLEGKFHLTQDQVYRVVKILRNNHQLPQPTGTSSAATKVFSEVNTVDFTTWKSGANK